MDAIRPIDPTLRDLTADKLAELFSRLGFDRYKSTRHARAITGGSGSVGLLDATPVGAVYGAQEGGRQAKEGASKIAAGDYKGGLLDAGLGVAQMLPAAGYAKVAAPTVAKGLLQAGDNLAAPRTLNPQKGAIVWHGSPHKFDRFDSSKIGTGEGAQAYGHGIYTAESRDVAQGYRDALSKNVTVDGAKLSTIPSDGPMAEAHNMVVRNIQNGMAPDAAISAAQKYWADAANEMRSFAKSNPELADRIQKEALSRMRVAEAAATLKPQSFYRDPGYLYKVDLPDPVIARMLDWDKPLSQQSKAVQDAAAEFLNGPMSQLPTGYKVSPKYAAGREVFQPIGPGGVPMTSSMFKTQNEAEQYALDMLNEFRLRPDTKGAHIYSMFDRNQVDAADMMRRAGVPGIRYLDGGSRGAGSGTSNFVIFPGEENILRILERNGIPLK